MAATYIGTQNETPQIAVTIAAYWRERLAEAFWFSLCLVLFMILGPFAAPIAVCFIFSNRVLDDKTPEPESLCENQI